MKRAIKISGTGCCLVDEIHPKIDFFSPGMSRYRSKTLGDGGLHPGRLVFSEHFEAFANGNLRDIIASITQAGPSPVLNIGGPSVVSLIHAAQLLHGIEAEVSFYGAMGEDETGQFLQSKLEQTPLRLNHLKVTKSSTPSTIVLSDPDFNNKQGERIFINDIGAAWHFGPEELNEEFFSSDIVVFGGTALVPGLHHELTGLLKKAKGEGCITVVNTVYDFQSELAHPGQRWKLGKGIDSYRFTDLLIMDCEEALNLSGAEKLSQATSFFIAKGVSSFIITNGTNPTLCYSDGRLFASVDSEYFSVSSQLIRELEDFQGGDTTGCGDNFVGGVLASMAWQLYDKIEVLNLEEAVSWGTVSGGHCCFQVGGTYIEKYPGEKLSMLRPYFEDFQKQIGTKNILIFGAGKIGRSFIGQLFAKERYQIVFVDMDPLLVSELNRRGSYPVIIRGPEKEERLEIENVSAIHALEEDKVLEAFENADIIAVSVGKKALSAVARSIAEGLLEREKTCPGRILDIILAENMRSADQYLREILEEFLPGSYPLDRQVGLVETSIGKMVPIMTSRDQEIDPLQLFAEPYNTLILDKKGFKGTIPPIKEFALKENMKAWVDRKAFIHNLGHATAAYSGYLLHPQAIYMYEILADPKVREFTRKVMEQSAGILLQVYPDEFTTTGLTHHIEDLLTRFQNKNLGDTLFRVGCDLHRKLGKDDRFMGIIRLAIEKNLPFDKILEALSMGFVFKAKDESGNMFPGDAEFHKNWSDAPDRVIKEVCGIFEIRHIDTIKQLSQRLHNEWL